MDLFHNALDDDGAVLGSELDCVGEEVQQYLLVPVLVSEDGHEVGSLVSYELMLYDDVLLLCQVLNTLLGLFNGLEQVEVCAMQVEGLSFHFGQVQQVIDQVGDHG